ncbi:MAG: hypothetical protein JWM85_2244 [Acidimicrobiaceae bacterium]|nr:hypothetical protein [Acidimicrobiaceae bacterium]
MVGEIDVCPVCGEAISHLVLAKGGVQPRPPSSRGLVAVVMPCSHEVLAVHLAAFERLPDGARRLVHRLRMEPVAS